MFKGYQIAFLNGIEYFIFDSEHKWEDLSI